MGFKERNLKSLLSRQFNVHPYMEMDVMSAKHGVSLIKSFYETNKCFTIRGDTEQKRDMLPFLVVDNNMLEKTEELQSFAEKCEELGCAYLFSTGRAMDYLQAANVVVQIRDQSVLVEVDESQGPLRLMYENPGSLVQIEGDLFDKVKNFKGIERLNRVSASDIDSLIGEILVKRKSSETYFECTLYKEPVGVLNKETIFWQVS